MKLGTKVTTFSIVLTVAMIAVIVVVSFLSFRQFTISTEREHIRSVADIVRISLNESLMHIEKEKRDDFLGHLATVEGLHLARVVRSDSVSRQFGKGSAIEQTKDEVEARVMRDGQPYYQLTDENDALVFRGTLPYVATRAGHINCLQCHEVAEGAVLGAITISMSMNEMMRSAYATSSIMVLAIVLFMLVMLLFFRRLVKPVITTAQDVQETVERAIHGDFHANIERRTNDEIGQVAVDLNSLLKFIQDGLTTISVDVAQLLQQTPAREQENLLNSTISRVEGLIDAAHFKQAIEEDETKPEIYRRLSAVLQERFGIKNFSIYEVVPSTNQMTPLMVDGEAGAPCRWCDPQILVHAESCRARRTGHAINSIDSPGICYAFQPPSVEQGRCHICIPVIQSGSVGSVLQLVVKQEESERIQNLQPYLNVYLREAAPVIEAKRLMDTLRASNLTDAMTGLHNRRFLEEFAETLVASNQRRKSQLSILMLDLDYFKMVNDTYGHDAGDLVLKALAKTMQASVRASDLVIRFGGEEFLIIMQDAGGEAADMVAEKIRAAVENMKVQLPGAVLQKTISIGIAEFPHDSDTFWQAVKYADVALYNAKETGRNRVVRFLPEMWKDEAKY
ncbi:MAG: diguanylate cyclase [Nitrosomonadales bacterium]|nr:diguanylate cyclase [Nitrosomonadales bacterium]